MSAAEPIILYVEDDANSRRMMRLLLETRLKLSQVTVFEDSADFVARVNALDPKPTLIFLDIHMKPYSGFEMLTMLRAMPWVAKTPIIALTASVMHEEVRLLIDAGFDGCLSKPIDLATFPDTLDRIMQGEQVWRVVG